MNLLSTLIVTSVLGQAELPATDLLAKRLQGSLSHDDRRRQTINTNGNLLSNIGVNNAGGAGTAINTNQNAGSNIAVNNGGGAGLAGQPTGPTSIDTSQNQGSNIRINNGVGTWGSHAGVTPGGGTWSAGSHAGVTPGGGTWSGSHAGVSMPGGTAGSTWGGTPGVVNMPAGTYHYNHHFTGWPFTGQSPFTGWPFTGTAGVGWTGAVTPGGTSSGQPGGVVGMPGGTSSGQPGGVAGVPGGDGTSSGQPGGMPGGTSSSDSGEPGGMPGGVAVGNMPGGVTGVPGGDASFTGPGAGWIGTGVTHQYPTWPAAETLINTLGNELSAIDISNAPGLGNTAINTNENLGSNIKISNGGRRLAAEDSSEPEGNALSPLTDILHSIKALTGL